MKSRPKSAGPLEFLKDTHKRKLQEYKMLLAGESFGLEEIVLSQDSELPCFAYTACTTSNSRLLFCPATKLLKLMKNDKQLTQDLLSRVEQRRMLRANQKGSCLRISETSPCEVSYKDRNEGQPFPPKYEVCKKSRSRNTIRSAEKLLYNLNRTTK
jgi:CRP-like cAMP-binding protein